MLKQRIKSIFRASDSATAAAPAFAPLREAEISTLALAEATRNSNGLDQFFGAIRGQVGLEIVDFADANQANMDFLTGLHHRPHFEGFLRALDSAFGAHAFYDNQNEPSRVEFFQTQTLDHDGCSIDGALAWDSLQFLSPPLLEATVDHLYRIMRPGGQLLAIFHADERAQQVPVYSYRISGHNKLTLLAKSWRAPAQHFNNRGLEKLFRRFSSVKFFLTRESLREVIVRR